MLNFNRTYFGFALLLLIIEVLIALFVNDSIIRPYFGDVLVVILLYCAIKSIFKFPMLPVALWVLVFSCWLEVLQYLNIVKWLGLEQSAFASTVIGTSFSWIDIIAYTTGIMLVIIIERSARRNNRPSGNFVPEKELYI